jgi:DNA-binding NarL/FixJ family response regulator
MKSLGKKQGTRKTELQFFATTGHSSDGTARLLPRAIGLIADCIEYAKSLTSGSHRYFFADVASLQLDGDKPDRIADKAATSIHGRGEHGRRTFFQREHQVLKLLANCKSNRDIASEMNISARTVETHRARVMIKLELHSIGNLVRFAVRNNIIKA